MLIFEQSRSDAMLLAIKGIQYYLRPYRCAFDPFLQHTSTQRLTSIIAGSLCTFPTFALDFTA